LESQRKFPYESTEQAIAAGLEHHRAGRIDEASQVYRQILVREPTHPQALYLFGTICGQRGEYARAVELISWAIRGQPNVARFHGQLGEFLKSLKKYDESKASFQRAIALAENDPQIHNSYGALLAEMRQFEPAMMEFRRAIELKADYADAHSSLGATLVAMGSLNEAVAELRKAIELNPHSPGAFNNLGNAHYNQGDFSGAIAAFNQSLALVPNDAKTHANLALAYLLTGDFSQGWREHEWRLKVPDIMGDRSLPQPRWNGETLDGKTILLRCEQGFGDMIQFLRFVPLVTGRSGRVVLESPPELFRLLKDFSGIAQLVQRGQALPGFDVQCHLSSLGGIFNTTAETIPSEIPYVKADVDLVRQWAGRFDAGDKRLRVGIAWAGRSTHTNDRNRSMPLAQLAPLASLDSIAFFSLQKEPARPADIDALMKAKLIDWTNDFTDFADTAAMIENLDLIVTVDTAVAHLAGAMGKQVWVMLPWIPDWRWMLNRVDSPWYPTARLFRQPGAGDWGNVLQTVAASLQNERR
jgi:Flp pilus assembly protein TadD